MIEERILRYAAPEIYKRMNEIFSNHNIHPYDVQAIVLKEEEGLEVTLRYTADLFRSDSATFSKHQVDVPDENVTEFFELAADQCKSLLIANYYKMAKI